MGGGLCKRRAEDYGLGFPVGLSIGRECIPLRWRRHSEASYAEIDLSVNPADRDEYTKVRGFFVKTSASRQITGIYRIENHPLFQLYLQERRRVCGKVINGGIANEELFWHGSRTPGAARSICRSGFDISYACSSPKGIWLSTHSNYSEAYCPRENGVQRMLLVLVTLGYIGQADPMGRMTQIGSETADSHHCGGTSIGHQRKDDQYGGGANNAYVILNDKQVYPAYAVDFK